MKKRILSLLVTLCLVLGLMPTAALAADGDLAAAVTAAFGDSATYDPSSNTITLSSNVTLKAALAISADVGTVILDLNGHTATGKEKTVAVTVTAPASLIVTGGGILQGGKESTNNYVAGRAAITGDGDVVVMPGVTVQGGAAYAGGAVATRGGIGGDAISTTGTVTVYGTVRGADGGNGYSYASGATYGGKGGNGIVAKIVVNEGGTIHAGNGGRGYKGGDAGDGGNGAEAECVRNTGTITAGTGGTAIVGGTHEGWTAWNNATSLPTTAGNYYLSGDVELTSALTISGEVNLCLNGHVLTQTGTNERVIEVEDGGTLNLCDCHPDAENTITVNNTSKQITGGVITGGNTNTTGGGVFVAGDTPTVCNMYGGTIAGNTARNTGMGGCGGGVYVGSSGGAFRMYGGAITQNIAGDNISDNNGGGGVHVSNGSTFTLSGGKIFENTAEYGGGVFIQGGNSIMSGGEISGNTAFTDIGGGVYVDDGNFTMSGGKISGNTAALHGGGVYFSNGTLTVSGNSTIANNKKGNMDSNVYLPNNKTITIGGALTSGAEIGVTTQATPTCGDPVNITGANSDDYSSYFTSDNSSYTVRNSGTGSNQVVQLAIAHTLTKTEAKAATCTEAGNDEYWTCSSCGKLFSDAAGTAEVSDVTIAAGHGYAYTAANGVITGTCQNDNSHTVTATLTASDATYDGTAKATGSVAYSEGWPDKNLTITYANNTNAGTATASITYGGATASVNFTIAKATPAQGSYTVPSDLTATEGQTLADITLPDGWAWADSTQSVGSAGTSTFSAVYTPADTDNYESVTVNVTVTVSAVTPPTPPHTHTWATTWETSDTHHWHKCTADGCDITDYSTCGEAEAVYAAHTKTWDKDATQHWEKCDTCGWTGEKTAHTWDDGEVTTQPTLEAEGVKAYTCTTCGNTKTETIDKLEPVTPPTPSDPGEVKGEVEVKPGTPEVSADTETLKDLAGEVTEGQTVTVTLSVEKQENPADKADIEAVVTGKANDVLYLDFSLLKQVEGGQSEPITDTGDAVLEIAVPYDFTGKKDVTVYRKHGDTSATALTELAQRPTQDYTDGSFFADSTGGAVYIYASKFSTYAIGYTEVTTEPDPIEPGPTDPIPVKPGDSVDIPGGGEVKGEDNGDVTITNGDGGTTTVTPPSGGDSGDITVDPGTGNVDVPGGSTVKPEDGPDMTVGDQGGTVTPGGDVELPGGGSVTIPDGEGGNTTVTVPDEGGTVKPTEDGKVEVPGGSTVTKPDGTEETVPSGGGTVTPDGTIESGDEPDPIEPDPTPSTSSSSRRPTRRDEQEPEIVETVCAKDSACPIAAFADTKASEWYHDGVHYCLENGLMVGTSSTTFAPSMDTSRAMIVTILWRQAGSPTPAKASTFDDVAAGAWYAQAVAWATGDGIVEGYGNGKFGPDDTITREQLAVILWRYAGKPTAEGSLDSFNDSAKASTWAVDALRWAVEQGIVTGKTGGVLDPTGTATRAEAATMLQRFLSGTEE